MAPSLCFFALEWATRETVVCLSLFPLAPSNTLPLSHPCLSSILKKKLHPVYPSIHHSYHDLWNSRGHRPHSSVIASSGSRFSLADSMLSPQLDGLPSRTLSPIPDMPIQWVYLGVGVVVGIIGGALFLCFWRLGFAALGGIAGFYFAIFVLAWASNGSISNVTGRTILIVFCVIIGVLMTFFVERHVVILGTALVGSGSFFVGLDNFVLTGFSDAFIQFLSGKKNGLEATATTSRARSMACLLPVLQAPWILGPQGSPRAQVQG
ncbi:MAG: hypothetical protein J3Q66DRAFT_158165 [Benniella sp.]|nr:MAG: hypothetical protein J3Q66DRAFT_158165 [Benniella sp.]